MTEAAKVFRNLLDLRSQCQNNTFGHKAFKLYITPQYATN